MDQVKVESLLKEVRNSITKQVEGDEVVTRSSSQKDEIRVMRAMLNDRGYKVGIYGKEGKESEYCPAEDARKMIASVITATAKIPTAEAQVLADTHEFSKQEAISMIGISKEYINTYTQTGRKLPLGGRETSNVALCIKEVEAGEKTFPKKVGVNEDGSPRYENGTVQKPAHSSMKVYGSCPDWVQ